jgi:hypothetical protein
MTPREKTGEYSLKHTILSIVLLCLFSSKATAQSSVEEVLGRFEENQKKLQSFIVRTESQSKGIIDLPGQPRQEMDQGETCEYRFDGDRFNVRWHTSEDDVPSYTSHLWEGNSWYDTSRGGDQPGHLIIERRRNPVRDKQRLTREKSISAWLGYYYGDDQRIDTILREAIKRGESVSLDDSKERIGGSNCSVITATTRRGKYTVWLDPQKDYNVVKAIVEKGSGDLFYDRPPMKQGEYSYYELDYVRYKKAGDAWLPQKAEWHIRRKAPEGYFEYVTKCNFTEVNLDPDHEALGSFVLDDVMNGARVFVLDVPNISYTWQDGELIPNIDEYAIEQLDKITDEIIAEESVSDMNDLVPLETATQIASTTTVSDLLQKYRATQDRLQSFIAKAESTTKRTGITQEPSSPGKQVCEFRFDGERVSHRVRFWHSLIATEDKPAYKSFLWDGERFIKYTQMAEGIDSRAFISKGSNRKKEMIAAEYRGAPLMGICAGDYERIDTILATADNISLREKTEKVGDVECCVINAATNRGIYDVWIDPEHGYNIAKVEVRRKKGDFIHDLGRAESSMSFSLENVRFKRIDGIWVPMEADIRQTEDNMGKVTRWHHKRTKMTLNPDHNKLGSFVADDIRDGTKVSFPGVYGAEFKWQNGKVIREDGTNVEF